MCDLPKIVFLVLQNLAEVEKRRSLALQWVTCLAKKCDVFLGLGKVFQNSTNQLLILRLYIKLN